MAIEAFARAWEKGFPLKSVGARRGAKARHPWQVSVGMVGFRWLRGPCLGRIEQTLEADKQLARNVSGRPPRE